MGKTIRPDIWLCAFMGALIGAFASLMVPGAHVSSPIARLSPSLFSFSPETSAVTASLAEDMRELVRSALAPVIQTVTLRAGDTLGDVLVKSGADRSTAQSVVEAVHAVYNPRNLQVGQELALAYETIVSDGDNAALARLDF